MDQPIEEPQHPMIYPDIDDLEPLYSDQEEVRPEPTPSLIPSPSGTSAPLLSNPALTDTLSNFPLFNSRAGSSAGLQTIEEPEPQERTDREIPEPRHSMEASPSSGRTASRRGRPPNRRRGSANPSSRTLASTHRPYTRSRGRLRTRAQSQTLERAMTLPNIAESLSSEQPEAEHVVPVTVVAST